MDITWQAFGDNAILIQWPQRISKDVLFSIANMVEAVQQSSSDVIIDIVPAYVSLTIFYQPNKISYHTLEQELKDIWNKLDGSSPSFRSTIWDIPVHYGKADVFDIERVCEYTNLSFSEIVAIHTSTLYDVHFIGFLPGFLYLGGLDKQLHIPRKKIPDLFIPKGTIAIGGVQTGIYPQNSPGGWYCIGTTDMQLIDFNRAPYCTIKIGDRIKFVAV